MKKTTRVSALGGMVVVLLLVAGYGTAFGQGTLQFSTLGAATGNGEVFQYDGTTPANTTFSAELLGSTTGVAGSFAAISPTVTFLSGDPGYIFYAPTLTPGPAAGTTYYYEIEVWTASAASYVAAEGVIGDQYGTTVIESLVLGGAGSPPSSPPNTYGFPNLTLTLVPVPEPATCALMGLGGLSLLLFRRRK
jgi:PEP-CTERM motif